jgi:hypothetical protein
MSLDGRPLNWRLYHKVFTGRTAYHCQLFSSVQALRATQTTESNSGGPAYTSISATELIHNQTLIKG